MAEEWQSKAVPSRHCSVRLRKVCKGQLIRRLQLSPAPKAISRFFRRAVPAYFWKSPHSLTVGATSFWVLLKAWHLLSSWHGSKTYPKVCFSVPACSVSQCVLRLCAHYQALLCPRCGNYWCHQRLIVKEIISFVSTPSWEAVNHTPGKLASLHFWRFKKTMLWPGICFIALYNESGSLAILCRYEM